LFCRKSRGRLTSATLLLANNRRDSIGALDQRGKLIFLVIFLGRPWRRRKVKELVRTCTALGFLLRGLPSARPSSTLGSYRPHSFEGAASRVDVTRTSERVRVTGKFGGKPRRPESLLGPPCPRRVLLVRLKLRRSLSLRGRASLGASHGAPLLETLPAVDRSPLSGLEGNRGFFTALRADSLGFDALNRGRSWTVARGAICLACFAPLRLVLEAFVGEKHLLAGSKNKLGAAFRAFQDLVVVFHCAAPPCWERTGSEQLTPDVRRKKTACAASFASRPARTA